jgi:hypothetical protein
MRVTRIAQRSIFDNYSEHDIGIQLCRTKVVMSGLSKVKVSSFAGVDFGGGVDQFEP